MPDTHSLTRKQERGQGGPAFHFSGSVDYILHTFAILNYPPHFVPDSLGVKCELRDVIHSFAVIEVGLQVSMG